MFSYGPLHIDELVFVNQEELTSILCRNKGNLRGLPETTDERKE